MIDESKKISLLAGRLLPPFVIEDYPQFAKFIKMFLQYIERQKGEYDIVANLLNYNDVDDTLSDFEYLFKEEFAKTFPIVIADDVALLVKNIRDFYKSKGTEDSFRFLFNTIFHTDVQFFYPKFHILKCSDGIWYTPEFHLYEDVDANIPAEKNASVFNMSLMVGQHIIGTRSGAEAYVTNLQLRDYLGNPEEYVEISEREGIFETGELLIVGQNEVYNGSFSALESGWFNSETDDFFYVQDGRFVVEQPATSPSERYIYQELDISTSGIYHLRYSIHSSDGTSVFIRVGTAPGLGDILEETVTLPESYPERGFVTIPSFSLTQPLYISLVSALGASQKVIWDGVAIVKEDEIYPFLFLTTSETDDPLWADTRGFLSADMYLRDNYYYQEYSYVLQSDITKDKYETIIKDNVHPAGYIMFGEVKFPDESFIGVGDPLDLKVANDNFEWDIGFEISGAASMGTGTQEYALESVTAYSSVGITYRYVEINRENTLVNSSWNELSTFNTIRVGDFDLIPGASFIYKDSFEIIIA